MAMGLGTATAVDRLAAKAATQAGADYALRLGPKDLSTGYAPLLGGGPRLTWRAVNDPGMPSLPNWDLSLGDVELF